MRQLHCNHACYSGFYTLATRCHICTAVTLKYTEASSLTVLRHSLIVLCRDIFCPLCSDRTQIDINEKHVSPKGIFFGGSDKCEFKCEGG